MDTVKKFLRHPTLKYHWVRYIPAEPIADEFWGRLQQVIVTKLRVCQLFMSDSTNSYWFPHQLRIASEQFRGEKKQPLLPDVTDGTTAYVSESYDEALDLPILKKLGSSDLTITDFLVRLEWDLDRKENNSYMRTTSTDDMWHTQVAQLLISAAATHLETIKELPLVPLSTGKWVHTLFATIHFPTSEGIEVPDDLSLNFVETKASQNESRRQLFTKLGVTYCRPSNIFQLIEQAHQKGRITWESSVSHVRYMFWHHAEIPREGLPLRLVSNRSSWFRTTGQNAWTYSSQSVDPYSALTAIGLPIPIELKLAVNIPHEMYYTALGKLDRRSDCTGPEWFDKFLQAKPFVQLCQKDFPENMSAELRYISRNKPEVILGVLQRGWSQYQKSGTWDQFFKGLQVPMMNSQNTQDLERTFLPLPKLCRIANSLGLDADFGFLRELEELTVTATSKWTFLSRFGVGMEEGVSFWLKLLEQARNREDVSSHSVFEIYSNLQNYNSQVDMERIR